MISYDPMILLAEDEEDDVFFMKCALRKAGLPHRLTVTRNGSEVIDYLSGKGPFADRSAFPLPQVLFLDLKMPFIDGFEVLAWMKENQLKIPVAVLTSSTVEKDIERALDLGAAYYMVKPPQKEILLSCWNELNS